MSRREHHPSVWLSVRLDPDLDADLIAWLGGIPKGQRSEVVRQVLRDHRGAAEPLNLDRIRQAVAEELDRVLAGRLVAGVSSADEGDAADIEAQFGSRLDRMLGGLAAPPDAGEPES